MVAPPLDCNHGRSLCGNRLRPLAVETALLHEWFVKRPVIDGTWKLQLRSNWKDPATQNTIPPIEGYMVVRQTFSTLSMRLLTAKSHSEVVGTEIICSA